MEPEPRLLALEELVNECYLRTRLDQYAHILLQAIDAAKSYNVSVMFVVYSKLDRGNTWITNMRESH